MGCLMAVAVFAGCGSDDDGPLVADEEDDICLLEEECPPGKFCFYVECVECLEGSDCSSGICDGGQCVECEDNSDCDGDMVCEGEGASASCVEDDPVNNDDDPVNNDDDPVNNDDDPANNDDEEEEEDPCDELNCGQGGECVVSGDEPQCECDDGFELVGLSCISEDPSSTGFCQNLPSAMEDLPDPYGFNDCNDDGVDGDAEASVFVSAALGDDGQSGTIDSPVETIDRGIEIADDSGGSRGHIIIDEGTYVIGESQDDGPFELGSDLNFYGGYSVQSDGTWLRSDNYVTEIEFPTLFRVQQGVTAEFQLLTLRSLGGAFPTKLAVEVMESAHVDATKLVVEAPAGGVGVDGEQNDPAFDGADGTNEASDGTASVSIIPERKTCYFGDCSDSTFSLNDDSESGSTCEQYGEQMSPGYGGRGGIGQDGDADMNAGGDGESVAFNVQGGSGEPYNITASDPTDGDSGADGSPGSAASAAQPLIEISSEEAVTADGLLTIHLARGERGGHGERGQSGAGGGGTAAVWASVVGWMPGETGYSGGVGGCGGIGGEGGGYGGSSVGVVVQAGGLLTMIDSSIVTGDGGEGGSGASGGLGGSGGSGGPSPGAGGDGGDGGQGGDGSGGQGGGVFGIIDFGADQLDTTDMAFELGAPGAGGGGSTQGPQGPEYEIYEP